MKIFIKIIDKTIKKDDYGTPSCIGEIKINRFAEIFHMPVDWWTMKDYQKQWKEGIERIKTHDKSCLVAEIYNPTNGPRVNLWILYKEGNKVFVQNQLLFGKYFLKKLKKRPFNLQTCYDFIEPRSIFSDDGVTKISEGELNLKK